MTTRILEVSASARGDGSMSRLLTNDLLNALEDRYGDIAITRRNVAEGLPFVDADWVVATNTPEEERSDAQRRTLAFSDSLVEELMAADIVVIGAPIYNFSLPASLKAWIDLIARVRLTFQYTDVDIIGAQGADRGNDSALDEARARIAELVHLDSRAA